MYSAHCWPTTAPFMRGSRMRLAMTVTPSQKHAVNMSGVSGHLSSDIEHARRHEVADHQHGQIGRRVVGARMAQILAADLAARRELEIGAEQTARARRRDSVRAGRA